MHHFLKDFRLLIHPFFLVVSGMEPLTWRRRRKRESKKRGQLLSRGQGSDWETVRDPVQRWLEHSGLNQQRR
jgi:hypothetical protein